LNTSYDVVIIGGGPAGSTAAAILTQQGRKVVVLEKEKFPHYSIGESMIPYCYFPLKRIGVIEKLKNSKFTKKYSVQFTNRRGEVSQPFYFFQHFDHEASTTWQVTRGEFDKMLMDNAREIGAEIIEQIRVKRALKEDGAVVGVEAADRQGRTLAYRASITIDASGRGGFFMTRNGWRIPDKALQKISIWTYYQGAQRDPGLDEGATTIAYLPENGWFWYLPLADDVVSVGVVADKDYLYRDSRDPDTIFKREVVKNQWINNHLSTGRRCQPYRVTGDFSYRAKYCAADGLLLTGDAFSFIDPVFSTGLFLALFGGELAADAVEAALTKGDISAKQFAEYGEMYCRAIESLRKLVYAFYDRNFNFGAFFKKHPDMVGDVTDCLIGNVNRDYDALFAAISDFAAVPEALPHGMPLIGH
jgi:flavin-dependent dehydrogenase